MVNKPLIRPYFWGGTLGGGWLTSHDECLEENLVHHPKCTARKKKTWGSKDIKAGGKIVCVSKTCNPSHTDTFRRWNGIASLHWIPLLVTRHRSLVRTLWHTLSSSERSKFIRKIWAHLWSRGSCVHTPNSCMLRNLTYLDDNSNSDTQLSSALTPARVHFLALRAHLLNSTTTSFSKLLPQLILKMVPEQKCHVLTPTIWGGLHKIWELILVYNINRVLFHLSTDTNLEEENEWWDSHVMQLLSFISLYAFEFTIIFQAYNLPQCTGNLCNLMRPIHVPYASNSTFPMLKTW